MLIGNAAAALQGAPVTTIDIDFLFRRTPSNIRKLKANARELEAVLFRPYYPRNGSFRISRDFDGLQINFKDSIAGVRSFEGLRRRAKPIRLGQTTLLVAPLIPASSPRTIPPKPRPIPAAESAGLALLSEKRTNFLRKRIGICQSCL